MLQRYQAVFISTVYRPATLCIHGKCCFLDSIIGIQDNISQWAANFKHSSNAVIGFHGDIGSEIPLQVQGDDLAFVGDSPGLVMHVAPGRQKFACGLYFLDVLADYGVTTTKQYGQIQLD